MSIEHKISLSLHSGRMTGILVLFLLLTDPAIAEDPSYGLFYDRQEQLVLNLGGLPGSTEIYEIHSSSTNGTQQIRESLLPLQQYSGAAVGSVGPEELRVPGSYFSSGSISGPVLRGSVAAAAPSASSCVTEPAYPFSSYCSYSEGHVHIYELWLDSLVVTAPSGVSEVQVRVSPYFEGTYGATGSAAVNSGTNASFFFNFLQSGQADFEGSFRHVVTGDSAFRDQNDHVMTLAPNSDQPFLVELQLSISANAGVPYGSDLSFVNALNTGSVEIEVLTPGATIQSASGYSYIGTVPEPQPVWLMSLGLLLISASHRRSRNIPMRMQHCADGLGKNRLSG